MRCEGIVAVRYCASDSICSSLKIPFSALENAGIKVPGLPCVIQLRQNAVLVGSGNLFRFGTKLAWCSELWQIPQTAE